jgi:hypothetical protein
MKRTSYLGHVIVVRRRRTGVRSFSSAFPKYDVYYQSQLLNTFSTMESAKQWIREHAERKRKNPTKAQKRPSKLQRLLASTKRAKAKRMSEALKKYLKIQNPGTEFAGAAIQRLKGGVLKITPIKAVRGRR